MGNNLPLNAPQNTRNIYTSGGRPPISNWFSDIRRVDNTGSAPVLRLPGQSMPMYNNVAAFPTNGYPPNELFGRASTVMNNPMMSPQSSMPFTPKGEPKLNIAFEPSTPANGSLPIGFNGSNLSRQQSNGVFADEVFDNTPYSKGRTNPFSSNNPMGGTSNFGGISGMSGTSNIGMNYLTGGTSNPFSGLTLGGNNNTGFNANLGTIGDGFDIDPSMLDSINNGFADEASPGFFNGFAKMFKKDGMLEGAFSDGNGGNGWLSGLFGGVMGSMQMINAHRMIKNAEDETAFAKTTTRGNFFNQAKDINNTMELRSFAQNRAYGQDTAEAQSNTDAYMKDHKLNQEL